MELENKTIIITGASSGIGAAAAELFASEGANVILGARRETELETVSARIKANGGNAVFLAGDVRDEGFADALVQLAVKEFGELDGAFNNAGILGEMGPIPDMDLNDWNQVMSVNLTAAFQAAKAQIPRCGRPAAVRWSSPRPLSVSAMAACRGWAPMRHPRPV